MLNRQQRRAYQKKTRRSVKYPCPVCGIDTVRIHKQTGIFEEGDVCEVCGKVFNRKASFPLASTELKNIFEAAKRFNAALPDKSSANDEQKEPLAYSVEPDIEDVRYE